MNPDRKAKGESDDPETSPTPAIRDSPLEQRRIVVD